jgi:hypothetical protein
MTRPPLITSTCNGKTIESSDPKKIISFWEAKGYQAQIDSDHLLVNRYRQQAEYHKREHLR